MKSTETYLDLYIEKENGVLVKDVLWDGKEKGGY